MSYTSTSDSTATTKDPLELLPNELFVLIFSNLHQLDIVTASSTNFKWRRVLLSNPTLYSFLRLKLGDKNTGKYKDLYKEVANLQIKDLIKASQLSQNRIKHLELDGECLLFGEYEEILSNWRETRFATLIELLSLSKDHLRTVEIELPGLIIDNSGLTLKENCQAVSIILDSLKQFGNLKRVKIIASTLMNLTYISNDRNPTPKVLVIKNRALSGLSEPLEGQDVLLDAITSFYEGSFTRFKTCGNVIIDSSTIQILEKSKSTLRKVNTDLAVLRSCLQDFAEFVSTCQGLSSLCITLIESPPTQIRPTIKFPFSSGASSMFKRLEISGVVNLTWDEDLFKWFGNRLEHLYICIIELLLEEDEEEEIIDDTINDQTSIDKWLFTSFLSDLSSTLKSIRLDNVFMSSTSSPKISAENQSVGTLSMVTLEILSLSSNMELINFFLGLKCSRLRKATLDPFAHKEGYLHEIDYDCLRRFLSSSSGSLTHFEITSPSVQPSRNEANSQESRPQVSSPLSCSGGVESLTFRKLQSLVVEIDARKTIECFTFNSYPSLKRLELGPNEDLESTFAENSPGFPKETIKRYRNSGSWESEDEESKDSDDEVE